VKIEYGGLDLEQTDCVAKTPLETQEAKKQSKKITERKKLQTKGKKTTKNPPPTNT